VTERMHTIGHIEVDAIVYILPVVWQSNIRKRREVLYLSMYIMLLVSNDFLGCEAVDIS